MPTSSVVRLRDVRVADPSARVAVRIEERLPDGQAAGVDPGPGPGYEQGLADGRAETDARCQALETEVDRWARQIPRQLDAYLGALEAQVAGEVGELAVKLAEVLVGGDLPRRDRVRRTVRELLRGWTPDGVLAVRVHPHDMARLRNGGEAPAGTGWNWVADESLAPGDVAVDTPHGMLESCLGPALEALADQLRGLVAEQPALEAIDAHATA